MYCFIGVPYTLHSTTMSRTARVSVQIAAGFLLADTVVIDIELYDTAQMDV